MTRDKFTRRQMLKLLGVGAIGAWAAACAPQQEPTQAPQATTAPAGASATKAPVATAVPAPRQPVTLRLMTWGSTTQSEARDAGLRAAYPELEATKVEFLVGGAGDADVAKALRLALAAGQNIPDMLQLNRTQIPEFAAAGEITDLGDVYAKYKNDLYAGALELAKYQGKYICFPNQLKSKIFYYRADKFDEAGIKVADIKTTSDWINAGKAFNAKFAKSYIMNLGPQPAQYWLGEMLSAYTDVRFADPGGNYRVTKDKAFADVLGFLKDVYDAKIAFPVDDFTTDWQKAFVDEAVCGSLISMWMKGTLPKFVPDQRGKWKATLWPALSPMADQRYGSDAGGSVYIVPKRCPHPQEAMDYLSKEFLEKKGTLACYQKTGMIPLVKSAKDDLMNIVRSAKKPDSMSDTDWAIQPAVFFGPEYIEFEMSSYEYLRVFDYDPSATKEIGILRDWLIKLLDNKATLAQALSGAEADMKSQIGDPYKV